MRTATQNETSEMKTFSPVLYPPECNRSTLSQACVVCAPGSFSSAETSLHKIQSPKSGKELAPETANLKLAVDPQDAPRVYSRKWYLTQRGYAFTVINGIATPLHYFVLNISKGSGIEIDHINRNPLDCRKENLRICTRSQNLANRKNWTGNYKGVSKQGNKWRAQIKVNKKATYLGLFKTEEEAALRYNEEAVKVHGDFAFLNVIKEVSHV